MANSSGLEDLSSFKLAIEYFFISSIQNKTFSITFPGFDRSTTMQTLAMLVKLLDLRGA